MDIGRLQKYTNTDWALKMTEIIIGEPTIELGDNRYLTHYVYEVLSDSEFVGHLFLTRYNYRQASDDKIAYRFMCQKDSYIEHNKDFILESSASTAQLPITIIESIPCDTGILSILDEVTFSPRFKGKHLEVIAIRKLAELWKSESDAIIVPDFAPMARHIEGISSNAEDFWLSSGFRPGPLQTMISTIEKK
jgi:hypothetical protein